MANYKLHNNLQLGFTFVEILIVLFIIMLLSTISYSSYLNYNEKAKLDTEANSLVLALEKAKKMAQSGLDTCDTFTGTYEVVIEASAYHLDPVGCSTLYDYTMPQAIELQTSDTVFFNSLGAPLNGACIIVEHTRTNKCRKVVLENSGTISNTVELDCACP